MDTQEELEALRRQVAAERRGRQQAERLLTQSRRETEHERREKERERIERERERQGRLDLEAMLVLQRRENEELQRLDRNQALRPFLALVSRLHTHLGLLTPPAAAPPTASSSAQQPSASSRASPSVTRGVTSIHGKYYPLALRPWDDFLALHRSTFSRFVNNELPGDNDLPSQRDVRVWEEQLLLKIKPVGALGMEFFNEPRTVYYIDTALESPAFYALRHIQTLLRDDERVFFRNNMPAPTLSSNASTLQPRFSDDPSQQPQQARSQSSSSSASSGTHGIRALPDSIVLAAKATADNGQQSPPRRVVVGEVKPFHALRHTDVRDSFQMPLPETYIGLLARQARFRKADKIRRQALNDSTAPAAPAATATEAPNSSVPMTPPAPGGPSARAPSKQSYFAHALAQTYHYMLVSCVEYGYLTTGETLTFLRIPYDDPTTLLYHTSLFPAPPLAPSMETDSVAPTVTIPPPMSGTDPVSLDALLDLPVTQLISLCLLGLASPIRSSRWLTDACASLAVYPNAPPPRNASPDTSSPQGRRPRDDGDDNSDDDNSDGSRGRGPKRRLQPPRRDESSVRVPSPLQQHMSADQPMGDAVEEEDNVPQSLLRAYELPDELQEAGRKPLLPFCTQACLLGLVRNGLLDHHCPNAALHVRALRFWSRHDRAPAADAAGEHGTAPEQHPITASELISILREHIVKAPEYDIECLYKRGYGGAIGFLFKITLTGYGYTFVGKGVEYHRRRRLQREARIYDRLQDLQGTVVPVHLGTFELRGAYPMSELFTMLPYMMLLSYAGEDLAAVQEAQHQHQHQHQQRRELGTPRPPEKGTAHLATGLAPCAVPLTVDLASEKERTVQALAAVGVHDNDDNRHNFLWCAELQRVVKIDFDRAVYVPRTADGGQEQAQKRGIADEAVLVDKQQADRHHTHKRARVDAENAAEQL